MLTKTYSAKEIHGAIVARNIAMITEIIELQKKDRVSPPAVVSSEYNRLCALGLGNTKNAQILKNKIDEVGTINKSIDSYNADIDKRIEFCKFVKEMLEVFGHNTLLVRFDDFEYIVKKYNLTCGLLEDYTGVIPEKNILELEMAKKNIEIAKNERKEWIDRHGISLYFPLENGFKTIRDYPSLCENIWELNKIIEVDPSFVSKECINAIKVFPFAKISKYGNIESLPGGFKYGGRGIKISKIKEAVNLFIVAPYKDMKNGVKFSHFVKSEDPFICSYTPFGIMIHTAWGEEDEDEVLSKYYNQLNLLEE